MLCCLPLTSPWSPWCRYLLAVHLQILPVDLHPHNDHLVVPLPPDGCVPEAARVQGVVDTPNDLGRQGGRYSCPGTEGQGVTQRQSNGSRDSLGGGWGWGWQGPLQATFLTFLLLINSCPKVICSFLNVLRMCQGKTLQDFKLFVSESRSPQYKVI